MAAPHGLQSDPGVQLLREHITPIPPISDPDFERRVGNFISQLVTGDDVRVVLIGDGSHGTSEFYTARAMMTRRLIEMHGFNIVAVEADWPDAEAVDRYVRHRPGPRASIDPATEAKRAGREPAFMRFPTWMWRNQEVQRFTEWLRHYNYGRDPKQPDAVGFYGLDLYSLGRSMHEVLDYLEHVDKDMAKVVHDRYKHLMIWADSPHDYGIEALSGSFRDCEKDVFWVTRELLSRKPQYASRHDDGEEFHSCEQNARVVQDAEQYYKIMYRGRDESWNLRDRHMFESLARVMQHRSRPGLPARAVVWVHNSHAGDARATSMGWARDELNIGQLCREAFGREAVRLVGCCTYGGTVAAARRWDGDMQVMRIRPALEGSYEEMMHAAAASGEEGERVEVVSAWTGRRRMVPKEGKGKNFVLDLREGYCDKRLREELMRKRLERFIGVIYSPHTERQSHYSMAVLPEQFDGVVWIDETRHVGTLEVHQPHVPLEYDETWPFGL
ncbi:hypothetical protein VTJ04DRAFT_7634 [Mycothermus thermophilus]|uniref:uncharacterized protein n=1 Tax=Humicola insolens TaxID=85995 RepID=UPI00374326BF